MTKKLSTFTEIMQKTHYWVDLFKKEQAAPPSKIRASRLLFLYTNVAVLLKDAMNLATDEERKRVDQIQELIPSQESLLALFVIIQKKSLLSSKDLSRFSVETRTELIQLRSESKLKEKKQTFQENLEQIIVLLQPFV